MKNMPLAENTKKTMTFFTHRESFVSGPKHCENNLGESKFVYFSTNKSKQSKNKETKKLQKKSNCTLYLNPTKMGMGDSFDLQS